MDAVAAAVSALAPGARRVGVEHNGFQAGDLDKLRRAVPQGVELLDASMLVRLIRMVKTEDEIERSARAAEVTEFGLSALTNVAAPGVTVRELADVFRSVVGANAADLEHVAVGPRGLGIATEGPYVLRSDDVFMLDVGCLYRSCISDTGVTVAFSPPTREVEEEYAILLACLETGAEKLRPGQRVLDIYKEMRAVVDGTVVAGSQPQGHGLGQEPKELPFISAVGGQCLTDECVDLDANVALEEGMVINLEFPFELSGKRWFQIERTFVIRSAGAEPISAQDRSKVVIAGEGRGGGQRELRTA
jgi:Xaa-Pro aminopeptidase